MKGKKASGDCVKPAADNQFSSGLWYMMRWQVGQSNI
jgi:hypothetical protein